MSGLDQAGLSFQWNFCELDRQTLISEFVLPKLCNFFFVVTPVVVEQEIHVPVTKDRAHDWHGWITGVRSSGSRRAIDDDQCAQARAVDKLLPYFLQGLLAGVVRVGGAIGRCVICQWRMDDTERLAS